MGPLSAKRVIEMAKMTGKTKVEARPKVEKRRRRSMEKCGLLGITRLVRTNH